jgi:soluble lytic murein transglycosylase-like protein
MNLIPFALAATLALGPLAAARAQTAYSERDWNNLRRSLSRRITRLPVSPGNTAPRSAAFAGRSPLPGHAETVRRYACAMELRPDLALAIAEQESNFVPATGPTGELGIMQVLPATAVQYRLDRTLLMDPEYGVYAGLTILSDLLSAFPEAEAVAAYNAGSEFRQRRLPESVVRKVERYVSRVLNRKERYLAVACR